MEPSLFTDTLFTTEDLGVETQKLLSPSGVFTNTVFPADGLQLKSLYLQQACSLTRSLIQRTCRLKSISPDQAQVFTNMPFTIG